jgi:hypothetical protein
MKFPSALMPSAALLQDLDAVTAEQRRAMKAILDDMKRTDERLDDLLDTKLIWAHAGLMSDSRPVESSPRRRRRVS